MQILICYIWLTPKKMVHVETTFMEKKQIPNVIMSKWMSGKVLVLDQLCMSMLHINIWGLY